MPLDLLDLVFVLLEQLLRELLEPGRILNLVLIASYELDLDP